MLVVPPKKTHKPKFYAGFNHVGGRGRAALQCPFLQFLRAHLESERMRITKKTLPLRGKGRAVTAFFTIAPL